MKRISNSDHELRREQAVRSRRYLLIQRHMCFQFGLPLCPSTVCPSRGAPDGTQGRTRAESRSNGFAHASIPFHLNSLALTGDLQMAAFACPTKPTYVPNSGDPIPCHLLHIITARGVPGPRQTGTSSGSIRGAVQPRAHGSMYVHTWIPD